MTLLLLLVLLASFCRSTEAQGQSLIPLSANGNAYQRGNAASNVIVDMTIDLTCSSCLDSWDMLNKVVETYEKDVKFMYRIFPLPYHQQAFILSKAAALVYYYSPDGIFIFMDTAFANQGSIYNSVTSDMTYNEVVDMVSEWAVNGTGVTMEQYKEGMNFTGGGENSEAANTIEMSARYMFKFEGLHDSFGTPFYRINGVSVLNLDTFESWQETLDPLLEVSN